MVKRRTVRRKRPAGYSSALRTFQKYYRKKPRRARRDRRRTAKLVLSGKRGAARYKKLGPNRADFKGVDTKRKYKRRYRR